MSVTAFPVLARILQERGLAANSLGVLALTCAAAADATAWCILAAVIAIVEAVRPTGAVLSIVLAACFVALMLGIVRPFLGRFRAEGCGRSEAAATARGFGVLLAAAWLGEVIGVHAVCGAFLAGIAMPRDPRWRERLAGKVREVSVLFIPLSSSHLTIAGNRLLTTRTPGRYGQRQDTDRGAA